MEQKKSKFFQNYPGHDRLSYPEPLVRVTGGMGGEAILILGSEKTAMYDCGMACFEKELIENIKRVLEREQRNLDYIVLSHTHYDHIGALPYVLQVWPDTVVCAGVKAAEVFTKPGARATMERLGNNALELYGCDHEPVTAAGLRVDRILTDGDRIVLGEEVITAYETKGHTDCSMSYLLEPQNVLFTSESTGIAVSSERLSTSPLKSYEDTFRSAERLKQLHAQHLIIPHYGYYPPDRSGEFFDRYLEAARTEERLLLDCKARGLTEEEAFETHKGIYWTPERAKEQPYEAYALNTQIIVKQIYKR